jgi:pantothenate kinase
LKNFTSETGRAAGKKGGVASGIAKRKAKSMREAARILLEAPLLDDERTAQALETLGLEPDQQSAILIAAAGKARIGDIEAARFVRDTSGQAPAQQVNLAGADGGPIELLDLSTLTNDELQNLLQMHQDDTADEAGCCQNVVHI